MCVIVIIKPTMSTVWQVVSGECGVLSAIKPGKAFVDMSTVEVETAVELYEVHFNYIFQHLHYNIFYLIH